MTPEFLSDLIAKSDADKIAALKAKATELVKLRVEHSEALAQLRGYNNQIEGPCRDPELATFLRAAKRGRTTLADLIKPGDRLSMKRLPFMLDGVFTPQDTNLVIGREKKGKTSFVIAWIAAWHFQQQTFCGFDITGDCPPVIVIGPDMTEQQWGKMLHQYHLASAEGELSPDGPIKELLHMGHDFCLDQHGLDLIDQIAEQHHNALFIFDSYSRLVEPLGLREETAEFASPLIQAQSILAKHQATGIWLHHSAANRETGKASSRGSTSLPAAADQIVFLEYPSPNEDDPRTLLRTKGRDVPVSALLERTKPDGVWICHASGDDLEQQRKVESRIDKLKPGLALHAFNAIKRRHQDQLLGFDLAELSEAIGDTDPSKLYRPMQRLMELCLVDEFSVGNSGPDGGRPPKRFRLHPSVARHLEATAKNPSTRGSTQTTPDMPETPSGLVSAQSCPENDMQKTSAPSRVQESHKTLFLSREPSADEVSGVVCVSSALPRVDNSTTSADEFDF
jgi:hypothetical protein